MIPIIQEETVTKKKWISDEDILDVVAIAESTPGPISLNTSTFVGYRTAGVFGAFCATLGVYYYSRPLPKEEFEKLLLTA